MSDFFPSGITLDDTASPLEVLEAAQQEWTEQSGGVLTLVIQRAESKNGNLMLIVHGKHVPSNRTVQLLSVVHRPAAHYPATIQPRDDDLPDFLKKTYYQPGLQLTMPFATRGYQVTNEWVCDTPAEFRQKLKEAFNLGVIKSEIISLVSGTASAHATVVVGGADSNGGESQTASPAKIDKTGRGATDAGTSGREPA